MTSPYEITRKFIDTVLRKGDVTPIVVNYMQELLIDMGNRYSMTDITMHIVAAAFKMHSDLLYSRLDENGKRACDEIIANSKTAVQEIKIPIVYKNGGKE
ncbi:MAG: hypothetical protein ACI4XF_11730 [Oscillospiraceae bacterium]